MWSRLSLVLLLAACADLDAPETALNCVRCVPTCASGPEVDLEDFEASARRLGCDPDLVTAVWPAPGLLVEEREPEVRIELARAPGGAEGGRGCDGAVTLSRLGRVGEIPGSVAVDIVGRASLNSLPVWPPGRDCVEGSWQRDGRTLRYRADGPLEPFVWYEVVVDQGLPFEGAGLCSELSWRFTVSPCGNGGLEHATSFSDWVCLGRVEAEQGYFEPYNEECDDGNREAGDACSAFCWREPGWRCDEDGCATRCGDGIRVLGQEECDLGKYKRPGCDLECRVEPGYRCDGSGCWQLGGARDTVDME